MGLPQKRGFLQKGAATIRTHYVKIAFVHGGAYTKTVAPVPKHKYATAEIK